MKLQIQKSRGTNFEYALSIKFLVAAASFACFAFVSPSKNEPKKINVVIDAGHGGNDFGAKFDSFTEKEIVAQITQKIKSLNQNENVEIVLTRSSDEPVSLQQRADLINSIKPDVVISLHVNSSQVTTNSGVALYVAKENPTKDKARAIALNIGEKFKKNHNFVVSEVKEAPFFVLNKSEAPGVILELGYISNDGDRAYLTDGQQQTRIARTILECINDLE